MLAVAAAAACRISEDDIRLSDDNDDRTASVCLHLFARNRSVSWSRSVQALFILWSTWVGYLNCSLVLIGYHCQVSIGCGPRHHVVRQ